MTQKTILLIDDDDDFLRLLQDRCEAIGLCVERTRNLLSATVSVSKRPPDIICVDVNMPTGNGLEFCEELAADPAKAQIPIVVLTSQTDPETRSTCERLRVHYVEKSTEFWRSLESILRQLAVETASGGKALVSDAIQRNGATTAISSPLHALLATNSSGPKPKKILVADDDQDMLQLLSQRFSSLGYSVVGVDNALDAINMIHRVVPDLVCLDIGMPSGSGLSVCEMMASDEQLRKIPTIVLTGRSDGETIRRCHDLLVYYVQKSADTWERVAPLVGELLGQETPSNVTDVTTQTWQTIQPTAIFASQKREPHDLLDAVFAALGSGDGRNSEAAGPDETGTEEADPKDIPWVLCIDDDADFSDARKNSTRKSWSRRREGVHRDGWLPLGVYIARQRDSFGLSHAQRRRRLRSCPAQG